jgi:hypothetical protein
MSNPTPTRCIAAAGNNPTAFVPLTLGCAANAIDLLVPAAPPITTPTDMKACCFDYLSNSLLEYAPIYSSAKLIATFHYIPGSTHNVALEAGYIASCIKASFFAISNLTGLGFCNANSKLIKNVTPDPSSAVLTVEFCLALPQSTPAPASQKSLLDQFNSIPTPFITLITLENMSVTKFALLGTHDSTAMLSNYNIACYQNFLSAQINNLIGHIPVNTGAPSAS